MAKKNGEKKTETAMVLKDDGYVLAKYTGEQMASAIKSNLEGEDLRPTDLARITVPSGTSKAFELPSLTGEGQTVKEMQGVIIHNAPGRAYWKVAIDEGGGNQPPDCFSSDGCNGIGDPGGLCRDCPMNVFGSAKKGRGKACKETRVAFLLRPSSVLPAALVVPPSSLGVFKKFKVAMTSEAKIIAESVVKIGLREDRNADGVVYNQLTFGFVKDLDEESAKRIAVYAESMKSALSGAIPDIVKDGVNE